MRKGVPAICHGVLANRKVGAMAPGSVFRPLLVAGVAILLVLVLAACEGGYTTTGEVTKESHLGSKGEINVHIRSANGSVVKEVESQYANAALDVEATLEVEQGNFKIELLGKDNEVTLVLEAGPGQKVSGSGYLVTDSFGEGEYRVTATEARGVSYTISYRVR